MAIITDEIFNSIPKEMKWSMVFTAIANITNDILVTSFTDYHSSLEEAIKDIVNGIIQEFNIDGSHMKLQVANIIEKSSAEKFNLKLGRYEWLCFQTGKPICSRHDIDLLTYISPKDLSDGKLKKCFLN